MRTSYRTIILAAALAASAMAASSCVKDDGIGLPAEGSVEIVLGEKVMTETKSAISPSETAIRNACLAVYDHRSSRLERTVYMTSSSTTLTGLVKGNTYDIYAVANMGDARASIQRSGADESGLRSGFSYTLVSYSGMSTGGLPMASDGCSSFTCGSVSSLTIPVERLAAKYNVRVDRSLLSEGTVTIRSAAIRQAAYQVLPFEPTPSNRWTNAVGNGDSASASDIAALNSGGSIAFYTLENRQGTLLPGNTDPWAKIPDNIPYDRNRCTYLEMECSYESETLSSDNVTYRMYLGENSTTNFDISRNTVYTLTFRPTDEGMGADSWKIDPGDVTEITYEYELVVSPSSASVKVGSTKSFTATYVTHTYTNGILTDTESVDCTGAASWSSSYTSIATVSGGTATGKRAGATTISATYAGETGSAKLSVSDYVTTSHELTVTPATATVNVGSSVNFTATYWTYTYTNGTLTGTTSKDVTPDASWTSSSTTTATVSNGSATGLRAGTAVITASYNGQSASAALTVQDLVEARYRITLSPAETTVNEGQTVTYTVRRYADTWTNGVITARDAIGTTIANSSCNWSVTEGADCASVSSAGVATANSMGTAVIKAALKTDSTVYATAVLNIDYTINVDPGSGGTGSGGNKF